MADDRHLGPRRHWDNAGDVHRCRGLDAAHQELVAVRQDDHLAGARPVALAARKRHPAPPRGDDVEQHETLRPRVHHRGKHGPTLSLESPALRVLGAHKDGAFEAEPLKGLSQRL
jgi:hypothetical protein